MSRLNAIGNEILAATFPYVDTVGVYDQLFNQVFRNARAIKASVREEAKVMEHPLETGATVTDHRVILPIEIELSIIVQGRDYRDTYTEIKQNYLSSTLLIVQTRVGVYINQLISSMPHEETPEMFSTITIALKLKEVLLFDTTSRTIPRNPVNTDTVQRGTQQGSPPTPVQQSSLNLIFNNGGM